MPELSTDHSSATLEGAHSHGGPRYVSSRADRPTSFDPADIPVPRGREEEWRFTPMKRFAPLFDLDTIRAANAAGETDAAAIRIETDLPDGARLETVPRSDARIGTVGAPVDRTGITAWNGTETATVLTLEPGAQLERAARLNVVGQDAQLARPTAQHILVASESGAKGTVVLDHTGTAALPSPNAAALKAAAPDPRGCAPLSAKADDCHSGGQYRSHRYPRTQAAHNQQ